MKRFVLLSLGLSFLMSGCEHPKPITKETPRSPEASPVPAEGDGEQPEAPATADPSAEPTVEDGGAVPEPDEDEAPDTPSAKQQAPAPAAETVNVRGKEYPYCRTPNEEGCIPRRGPTRAPAWK